MRSEYRFFCFPGMGGYSESSSQYRLFEYDLTRLDTVGDAIHRVKVFLYIDLKILLRCWGGFGVTL